MGADEQPMVHGFWIRGRKVLSDDRKQSVMESELGKINWGRFKIRVFQGREEKVNRGWRYKLILKEFNSTF